MKPNVGDLAPDFSLPDDTGEIVSRDSLLGTRYVLYFYPKDDTPGCTAQACSMRDNFARVTATGVQVFGVSPDSVKSHQKFREKYDLPYRLLADEGHRVADAFGVWVEKSYMGRTYMGVERSSFIIGPDGRVEHVLERVKPAEHVDLLLEAMAA
ncbi:MAG TPA: thioredoxin-dependent thiol peroxidase [candidate division Zixibacteria bacterium]|nr:thioredoxin-dependent thiol peroxidase [candidate division Zixibacteria bacterium]